MDINGNITFNNSISSYCLPGSSVQQKDISRLVHMFQAPSPAPVIVIHEIVLKISLYVIAFVMDIVGNVLVMLIIYLNKRMHCTTNYLIMNLAISDILVGLFCMWVHIGNEITPEWPFGDLVCKVNTFIQVIAVTLSVLSLTTISADRFMAIVFPLRSRMSSTKASIVISMIWFISISVAAPQLIVRHQSEFTWADRHEVYCDEVWPTVYINTKCETDQPVRKIYYIIFILVLYFIPILVMIVAYSIIVLTLMKRKAPGVAILSTTLAQEKSKRKVIKMLIVVLIVFILCWSPQQILLLWGLFRSKKQFPAYIETVRFVALYVAYLNSSLNPILYCGFNENFRKGFIDAFRCSFSKKTLRIFPMRNIERTSSGIGERHSSRCRSIQERPHTEVTISEETVNEDI